MKKIIKNAVFRTWLILGKKTSTKHLFLMGHPRSGSSLLLHILSTNPEISGFGEYHRPYRLLTDVKNAEFDIRRKTRSLFKKLTYVVNQINHHSITPQIEAIKNNENKFIFLIRKPEETLWSWANLVKNKAKAFSHEEITSEYIRRLKYFKVLASEIPKEQRLFLTYEELVSNPSNTLKRITSFLQLQQPLTPNYNTHKFSQKWGDPSKNIKKGMIINTQKIPVKFDDDLLLKATKSYEETFCFFQK